MYENVCCSFYDNINRSVFRCLMVIDCRKYFILFFFIGVLISFVDYEWSL